MKDLRKVAKPSKDNWKLWVNIGNDLIDEYEEILGLSEPEIDDTGYRDKIRDKIRDSITSVKDMFALLEAESAFKKRQKRKDLDDRWNYWKKVIIQADKTVPGPARDAFKNIIRRRDKIYFAAKDSSDPALGGSSGFDPGTKSTGDFTGSGDDVEQDAIDTQQNTIKFQGKRVPKLNKDNWKQWIVRAQRLLGKYAYTYGSRKKTESINEELRYYMRLVEKPKDNIDWSKIEPMSGDDERDWNQIRNMFSAMGATLPDEATKAWKDLEFQKSKGDVDVKAKQRAQADTDDPALGGSSGFDPGKKFPGTFTGNADDVERDAERDAADARLKTQANANDRLDKFKQDKTDGTQYAKSKGDLGYYADYINAVLSNPTADNLVTQANKVLGEIGFFETRWNAMNNFYGIIAQELGLEGLISHVDTATNPPQVFYSRAKQTELSKKLGDKMPRGEFESDNVDFSDPKHRKIAQAQLNKNLLPASITYQQQKVNPQEEFGITKTADDSTKPMMSQDDIEKKYGITSDQPAAAEPTADEPTADKTSQQVDKNKPSVDGGQAAGKVGKEFGKKLGSKINKDKMPTGTYAYDRYVPIPKNLNRLFRGERTEQYYVDRIPLPGRGLMSSQLQITSDTKGTGFETVHDTKFNRARDAIYQFLKDNNTALIDQAEWAKLKKWNDMAGDGPGGGDILNAPNDRWKTKRKGGDDGGNTLGSREDPGTAADANERPGKSNAQTPTRQGPDYSDLDAPGPTGQPVKPDQVPNDLSTGDKAELDRLKRIDQFHRELGQQKQTSTVNDKVGKIPVQNQDANKVNDAPDSSVQSAANKRPEGPLKDVINKAKDELSSSGKEDYEQYQKNLRKKDNSSTDFTRLLKNAGLLKEFY